MAQTERTFIAVKPDGMNRGLLGAVISRFEAKGYKLVAIKTVVPTRKLAETHYDALKEKPFFKDLVDFITSGPVCAMVWEGSGVVVTARKMIGETNPLSSAPGTIRGDFAVDVGRKYVVGLMIMNLRLAFTNLVSFVSCVSKLFRLRCDMFCNLLAIFLSFRVRNIHLLRAVLFSTSLPTLSVHSASPRQTS